MTVYVDSLLARGWVVRGRQINSCHMFSDQPDMKDLHAIADKIRLKPEWFQGTASTPHYDLMPERRAAAVAAGAVEVDRRRAVEIWRALREAREKAKVT